jgi:hypothetical protein
MPTQYVTRFNTPKWFTQDGQLLLEMNGSTATPSSKCWNAEHLRALATACLEAASELDRGGRVMNKVEQVKAALMNAEEEIIHLCGMLNRDVDISGSGMFVEECRAAITTLDALSAENEKLRDACEAAQLVWEQGCVDRGYADERNWIDEAKDKIDEALSPPPAPSV